MEHGDHREKYAKEEPADLLDWGERKFIGQMHTFRCRIIRSDGGREHNRFAQEERVLDENRAENDREKENVAQPLDVDLARGGFFFPGPVLGRGENYADRQDKILEAERVARQPSPASNAESSTKTVPL